MIVHFFFWRHNFGKRYKGVLGIPEILHPQPPPMFTQTSADNPFKVFCICCSSLGLLARFRPLSVMGHTVDLPVPTAPTIMIPWQIFWIWESCIHFSRNLLSGRSWVAFRHPVYSALRLLFAAYGWKIEANFAPEILQPKISLFGT